MSRHESAPTSPLADAVSVVGIGAAAIAIGVRLAREPHIMEPFDKVAQQIGSLVANVRTLKADTVRSLDELKADIDITPVFRGHGPTGDGYRGSVTPAS